MASRFVGGNAIGTEGFKYHFIQTNFDDFGVTKTTLVHPELMNADSRDGDRIGLPSWLLIDVLRYCSMMCQILIQMVLALFALFLKKNSERGLSGSASMGLVVHQWALSSIGQYRVLLTKASERKYEFKNVRSRPYQTESIAGRCLA